MLVYGNSTEGDVVDRSDCIACIELYFSWCIIYSSDPDDYMFATTTVTFSPGETSQSLSIPIIPDLRDELDETFKLTITIPDASRDKDVSEGSPIMTVVLIKDSDGELLLIFAHVTFFMLLSVVLVKVVLSYHIL